MKFIAFILATYISLLTVQPVAEQVYASLGNKRQACTMACCKHKETKKTKKECNNCCDKGVCNPFGMYNCCFVYNPTQTMMSYAKFTEKNKFIPATENNFVSSFLSDCFHPPEIA